MAELERGQKSEGASGVTLSVVTATYNAASVLPALIKSLQAQTDPDFEWVVADGGSTDGTLELLAEAAKTMRVRVDSRPDFGIYDALNRGVQRARGDYYVVIGADDKFFPDAISNFKTAISQTNADFISAMVEINGRPYGTRKRCWKWLYGAFAFVGSHAVGLAIKKNLHNKFGLYSKAFPITADLYFIQRAIDGGACVSQQQFIAGCFCTDGTSGQDVLGVLLESFRVQILTGESLVLQLVILVARVIRHCKKIILGSA